MLFLIIAEYHHRLINPKMLMALKVNQSKDVNGFEGISHHATD
jgi:hypothetical protein